MDLICLCGDPECPSCGTAQGTYSPLVTLSKKAPEIEAQLRSFAPDRGTSRCATCGRDGVMRECDFRDDLSLKEASMSWMCQDCQDSFFTEDED
jgi:hypothetical protein